MSITGVYSIVKQHHAAPDLIHSVAVEQEHPQSVDQKHVHGVITGEEVHTVVYVGYAGVGRLRYFEDQRGALIEYAYSALRGTVGGKDHAMTIFVNHHFVYHLIYIVI